jgi:hypothetical protein
MYRRVNSKRLRELIDSKGDFGLAMASQGARVSVSMLEKMYAGTYQSTPRELVRERISAFFNVPENELFPLVSASRKRTG